MLWERYTERARKAMLIAEDWAIRLKSPFISPEHLLLGLLELGESIAFTILERLGVETRNLKSELETRLREQVSSRTSCWRPNFSVFNKAGSHPCLRGSEEHA